VANCTCCIVQGSEECVANCTCCIVQGSEQCVANCTCCIVQEGGTSNIVYLIVEMQVEVTVSVDMSQVLATDSRHDKSGVIYLIAFTAGRSAVPQTVLLTQAGPRTSFTLSLRSETWHFLINVMCL